MGEPYLDEVIRRGNELALLDQAAALLPKKASAVRWAVAAACCALISLFPSVCSAQAFFHMI